LISPSLLKNLGFNPLRPEGAFLISAQKQDREMKGERIFPEKSGELLLKNPFSDKRV